MFRVTYCDFNGEAHVEVIDGGMEALQERLFALMLSGCENIATEMPSAA